jgi:poly-gamma-glutamate synthesis protein (capsule biosynthesis protein)
VGGADYRLGGPAGGQEHRPPGAPGASLTRLAPRRAPALALALGLAACNPLAHAAPVATRSPIASPSPSPSPTPIPPTLTVDSIFQPYPDHAAALAPFDRSRVVELVVTGDVIPARKVNQVMVRRGDFLWPFREAKSTLAGDVRLIDLESPLLSGCPVTETGLSFCGDPRFIDGLTYAGVDVASLSNNHLTNYGQKGSQSTIQLLTDHGIRPTGLGLIAYMTVKNVRFAFLGFNGIGVHVDRAELKRQIDLARPNADVVVVEFHWGKEYVLTPQSTHDVVAPDDPREIGHLAVDDGADLVIGNHPHAVQGVEMYNGKLITYAHGNFVFDQMWEPDPGQEDPRNGVVGHYYFLDGRLVDVWYQPIRIFDYGQPRLMGDATAEGLTAEGQAVLDRMRLSTRMIAGG